MAQENMFWKLVPENVVGQPAELWRVKKDKMVARGGTWTEHEWGPRTLQLRSNYKGILGHFRG